MILDLTRTVALRCPECGKLETSDLSLFDARKGVTIECSCGFRKLGISRKGRHYRVEIACIICEASHTLTFESKDFLSSEYITLYCPESDVELGYFGSKEAVDRALEQDMDSLEHIVTNADDDYFFEPEIMQGVLSTFQSLAEVGRVRCECGNDEVSVNVYPDRAELVCPSCGSLLLVYAETEQDLEAVRQLREITLKLGSYSSIDGTRLTTHGKG